MRLYTQIYSEATRARAEQLRQDLQQAGMQAEVQQWHVAPIENVARTAAMRQQRPPVPWRQPTIVVHDAALRPCADALAGVLQQRWPQTDGQQVWVTGLPGSLKGQPNAMELWLPTTPTERAAVR